MSAWILGQIFVNVILGLGVVVLWFRLKRPPQDDPRLSRGLQLLQSKISVLEDLSDRTDSQVKQLTGIMDQKARLLQNKIVEAEHQVQRVDQAMRKSKEVAEIFQDKIPHQEILERQQTIKYVTAAQMAHAGKSLDEISDAVDLPIGQIELIAKFNKDQLMFDSEALPEWAKGQPNTVDDREAEAFARDVLIKAESRSRLNVVPTGGVENLFDSPSADFDSLKKVGEDFRNAVEQFDRTQIEAPTLDFGSLPMPSIPSPIADGARGLTNKVVASASKLIHQVEAKAKDFIESPERQARPAQPAVKASTPMSRASTLSHPLGRSPLHSAEETSTQIRKVQFPKLDITK